MLPIRDVGDAERVTDETLRQHLTQRLEELGAEESYGPEVAFFVVEPGDSLADVEAESACPIVSGLFGGPCYGQPGYRPSYEVAEAHASFYEVVWAFGGGDDGTALFIPRAAGIDPELLRWCGEYAIPAPAES